MTGNLNLPKDPRRQSGGFMAPWRNPALSRRQRVLLRCGERRIRGGAIEGAVSNEGKGGKTFGRIWKAFAGIIAGGHPKS